MVTALRLVVDPDRCVMAGECIYNHPDYFAWADEASETPDTAVAIKPDIGTDEDRLHAQQAIELCPGGAISIAPG